MTCDSGAWQGLLATRSGHRRPRHRTGIGGDEKFLRILARAYTAVVGLLILWSWCAELAPLHDTRELPTAPEWLLYVVTLPASHFASSLFGWADSSISWRLGDVVVLTALGAFQVAVLSLLARQNSFHRPMDSSERALPAQNGLAARPASRANTSPKNW